MPPTDPGAAPAATAAEPILARLTGLHPKLIDLSLDRIKRLLERLGRPQYKLAPVVHQRQRSC